MTLIRRTIATRLVEATQSMAMLTTFNKTDMSEVKILRKELGDAFSEKFGVRLGFMSFFIKAAITGLLDFPLANARIDEDGIVYHDYCDIGVAIGGGKGLVVPVIHHGERLNLAELERRIADLAQRAKNNTLSPEELRGGTLTISNGGVCGSMLSTPIVNPPQSAILPDDYAMVSGTSVLELFHIRLLIEQGDSEIPVRIDGNDIITLLELSNRQRQRLLAGGMLNLVRHEPAM